MLPPCAATMARVIDRPRPTVSDSGRARDLSPRKKRSNKAGSRSGAMPGPSFSTATSTSPARWVTVTLTLPRSGV